MKRLFDILASGMALLLLSPLLLPVIIILRLTGEGEIFYGQQRIGRNAREFSILKFATMLKNSPAMVGGDITVGNDPRILPFGRFLRSSKINELPQLINVLRGDMSLIGPRPLTRRVADMFPAGHWESIGTLRPGLSGVGSIIFRGEEALLEAASDRNEAYRSIIAPYKSALEFWYLRNQSFLLDLKLTMLTVAVVVLPGIDPARFLPGLPAEPENLRSLRHAADVKA
jgi:lipopolysaccharide/colanic/teichoic acid biosynthesis glycosyltransferase